MRQLGLEIATPGLAAAGLQLAHEFEVQSRLDEAIGAVEARGRAAPGPLVRLLPLAFGVAFSGTSKIK